MLIMGSLRAQAEGVAPGINSLFDRIIFHNNLKNDAALSKFLGVNPPLISKLRHGRFGMSGEMIIMVHEMTDWPIKDIKATIANEPAKAA